MVLDVVRKRAWYFLFSALIILPGLVSMILPPGWLSGDSGLNAGIDFASGSILIVTFDREASEDQIQDRMNRLGHSEALIQRVGGREFQIRTTLLEEGVGDAPSEREVIERDLEESLQLDRGKVEFASVSPIVAKETVRNAFYSHCCGFGIHNALCLVRFPAGAQGVPVRNQRHFSLGPRRHIRLGCLLHPRQGYRH